MFILVDNSFAGSKRRGASEIRKRPKMATTTVTRFHLPKSTLFPMHMKKQKTTQYPDIRPKGEIALQQAAVRTLAWSPFGTQIATATATKSIKLWDPEKARVPVAEFLFRGGDKAEKVLFHPGGEPEVVSVGEDGMVRFFDVRTKSASGEIKAGGACFTLAWSPDGNELVVGKKVSFFICTSESTESDVHFAQNDDLVRIDRATRAILSTTRMKDTTNQTTFNWVGDTIISTTIDGAFIIHDYPSFTELARFAAHNSSCNCVAYHPAGAYVATGASDGLISLYRTDGWLPTKTFDANTGPIKNVSFSCDGTYVVGGSDEGQGFEIGMVETGESVYKVESRFAAPVVVWSPRDYAIAYVSADWGIKVVGAPAPS